MDIRGLVKFYGLDPDTCDISEPATDNNGVKFYVVKTLDGTPYLFTLDPDRRPNAARQLLEGAIEESWATIAGKAS